MTSRSFRFARLCAKACANFRRLDSDEVCSAPNSDTSLGNETVRKVDAPIVPSDRPALALPDKPSIALLPFDNMSDSARDVYFADGIAEEIITDLSRYPDLFVAARNSSFSYRDKAVRVADVARELGVHFVLEGSVRRAGSRIRINTQLIDGASGRHLWAERYDRSLEDIFAVQVEPFGRTWMRSGE
jgi:adenylate cyclase